MVLEIVCPHCQKPTQSGRVICPDCGGRMAPPGGGIPETRIKKDKEKARRIRQALIQVITFGLFLTLVVLLLWPQSGRGNRGDPGAARSCYTKLGELDGAIRNQQRKSKVFSEEEVNAYLFELLRTTREKRDLPGYFETDLKEISVEFKADRIVLISKACIGPATLSWRLGLAPDEDDDMEYTPRILEAGVGHLPLPGPLSGLAARQYRRLFQEMKRERFVFDGIAQMKVKDGQMAVLVSEK